MMPAWLETLLFWWGTIAALSAALLLIAIGYVQAVAWLREWDADRRWLDAIERGHIRLVYPPYDWEQEA